jgi:glycosyltransferase involved in cell wall biosynthesis
MPGPRHILMVNTEHGWRGGENQIHLLVCGLDRQRFRAITACQEGGDLEHRLAESGAQTLPVRARGGFDLRAASHLRRAITEHAIDLVHAHASHAHSLCVMACMGLRVPLLVSRRVDFPIGGNPIGRWKYRRARRVVAVSEGVRTVLISGGVAPADIDVIHDGVDPARVAQRAQSTLRAELGIPASAVVFGIVAFLSEHKDHRTLLQAFREVEARLGDAWLLIAGEGELESDLTALSRELGLQRCRFLGFRPDVAMVFGALDVFVLSSHHEGLGSSVMDAMFAALPVVATRVGGLPELVDDQKTGILVGARDPAALASAMIELGSDPQKRRRLGDAGRTMAQSRFAAARMVEAYQSVYERMCR